MIVVKKEILINTGLEKVYRVAETYPCFVDGYKEKNILYQDDIKLNVKVTSTVFGLPLKWTGEGIKIKNKEINFIQKQGPLRGLEARWYFEKINGKTKVSIEARFKSDSMLMRLFEFCIAEFFVKKTLQRILKSLKDKAEEKS